MIGFHIVIGRPIAALWLVDVNFTDNAARHGGALLLRGVGATGATAKRVRFDDNTASQLGGGSALYDGAVLSGEHVRFSGNRAVDGAGLHLAGQATGNGQPFTLGSGAAMFDAVFDGNEASGLGGAAYVFGIKPPMGGQYSVLHLYDSRVARNLAAEGGGIWSRGQMRLRDSSFDDNGALRGGALTLAPSSRWANPSSPVTPKSSAPTFPTISRRSSAAQSIRSTACPCSTRSTSSAMPRTSAARSWRVVSSLR